ncbi:hypothetical protein M3Y97_00167900 [Aphelenchoides bicaudatus]|nr:hypothetical protein M3Y97_00167900 [Aphelenchoides bicaudatus]
MYIVNAIELFINAVGIFIGFLAARTITRHTLFHFNLRLLMNIMGVGWFLLVGSRMASIVQQFIYPDAMLGTYVLLTKWPYIVLEIARVTGCSLIVISAMIGIGERLIASIFLEKYVDKRNPFCVILAWILSTPSTVAMTYYSFSPGYGAIIALVTGALGILTFFAFVTVDRWNRRRLDLSVRYGISYSLNQRFQLSENVRAAELVYRASVFGCFGSTVVVTLILMYKLMDNATQIYILRSVYNIQLSKLCPRFIQPNRINSARKTANCGLRARIQNLDGVQLEFSNEEEGRRYFDQLKADWS